MKPFFSVVIPTLNEEKYLPKLLGDLSKQTEKDFEVIVADGYSKDNTGKTIDEFKNKLNIYFYQTKLKNVAAQRNQGGTKSIGEYLVFLDADIRVNPAFLKKIRKTITKKKGLIFLPYSYPDKEYRQYKPLFDAANILVELSQNLPKKFSLGGQIIIEKNFFHLIGGFNKELFLSEDHELIQRASSWGVNPKFIKETWTYFSLRRMKKEGQLKFFYQYFIAFAHRVLTGETTKKIFEYKMGGQAYLESENKPRKEEFFEYYLNQTKDLFKRIMND